MNRVMRTAAVLLSLMLLPSVASAELRRVQLSVLGMDCVYCAQSVSGALKKLEGVETVDVSLEKSSAVMTLKAENTITLPQLRRIIRSIGYQTRDAQVTARGKITDQDGKAVFDLLNGSVLELAEKPKDAPADTVEITGVSQLGEKDSERLTVGAVKK